jgi:hypothetical protein
MLTLAQPLDDDLLKGVVISASVGHHPALSVPSRIDQLHAAQVYLLTTICIEKGRFEEASPMLSTSAKVSDFLGNLSANGRQHAAR